jgi:hypothetical protein
MTPVIRSAVRLVRPLIRVFWRPFHRQSNLERKLQGGEGIVTWPVVPACSRFRSAVRGPLLSESCDLNPASATRHAVMSHPFDSLFNFRARTCGVNSALQLRRASGAPHREIPSPLVRTIHALNHQLAY